MSLRDVERAMIVFEYFFSKMDLFGPKMDKMRFRDSLEMEDVKEVCLSVFLSLCVLYVSVCSDAISTLCQELIFPLTLRYLLHRPPFVTPSLAHSFLLSVFATMPDCRTEQTMKRVLLQSSWSL